MSWTPFWTRWIRSSKRTLPSSWQPTYKKAASDDASRDLRARWDELVSEGRLTSGFACPVCEHQEANLLGMQLPQLELECSACGWRFAVETT